MPTHDDDKAPRSNTRFVILLNVSATLIVAFREKFRVDDVLIDG